MTSEGISAGRHQVTKHTPQMVAMKHTAMHSAFELVPSGRLSAESCFTVLVLACLHAGRYLVHKQAQATARHRQSCKPCLTSLARRTGLMWKLCSRQHGRSTCRGCRAKPLHCTGVLMPSVACAVTVCMHACVSFYLLVLCLSSHLSLYLCESSSSCLSS